jgi:hypothetical protein
MRYLTSMSINEQLNNTSILIMLFSIKTLNKLKNLIWLPQKVISYALSIKHFETRQEIIVLNLCVETNDIIHLSWIHV